MQHITNWNPLIKRERFVAYGCEQIKVRVRHKFKKIIFISVPKIEIYGYVWIICKMKEAKTPCWALIYLIY